MKITIVPIEPASKDEVIHTHHKGINIDWKNIRHGRKHMKLIMSSIDGFLEQPTLSNKQLANRNRQLMSIFPYKWKALSDWVFILNVSANQSKAFSNLFYLLSFDAPLRIVFPEEIMESFRKMLQKIDKWCNRSLKRLPKYLLGSQPSSR